MANFCTSCGQRVKRQQTHCLNCGEVLDAFTAPKLNPADQASAPEKDRPTTRVEKKPASKGFQWGWALKSAGLTFLFIIVLAFFFGFVIGIFNPDPGHREGLAALVGIVASFSAFFLGSGLAAYLSPGRTIYEPAVGVALAVTALNIWNGNLENLLFGWIVPFGIGFLGARAGEHLQERRERTAR